MINSLSRRYMHSDATKLSSANYKDIIQYQDMKFKPLDQLRKRFHVLTSCLYQIWREQEVGRVEWNYSAVPLYYSNTNIIDRQDISKTLSECNIITEKSPKGLKSEELHAFYKNEAKRDEKIKADIS
ncbi:7904_t:CDS:2, partial [Funneliformis geosporum]